MKREDCNEVRIGFLKNVGYINGKRGNMDES